MSIHEEIAADAAEVFREFGKPVGINDRTIMALVSEPTETVSLEAGGFVAEGNFTVKLLRSSLDAAPEIGATLLFAGQNFRIVRTANRPPHPILTLTVEPIE